MVWRSVRVLRFPARCAGLGREAHVVGLEPGFFDHLLDLLLERGAIVVLALREFDFEIAREKLQRRARQRDKVDAVVGHVWSFLLLPVAISPPLGLAVEVTAGRHGDGPRGIPERHIVRKLLICVHL